MEENPREQVRYLTSSGIHKVSRVTRKTSLKTLEASNNRVIYVYLIKNLKFVINYVNKI